MKETKFTFQSETLVVDWISFNFQSLENNDQKEIVSYLSKLGFNSYSEVGKLAQPVRKTIHFNSINQFEVLFVQEIPYWTGTTLRFSGVNAAHFYNLVQKKLINWKIFSSAILGRFDLYYNRTNQNTDKISPKHFLNYCLQEIPQQNPTFSLKLETNKKGWILTIGSRRSDNYSRIYEPETENSLKFELEMKGHFIQNCHFLLVQNRLEEFEHKLSSHFLVYFGKLLPLKFNHVDWLLLKLRPQRKQESLSSGLNVEYIRNRIQLYEDRRKFWTLLKFLTYAQKLDYEIDSLGDTSYRRVCFQLQDFRQYMNQSDNYYQLKKNIEFFDELQQNSIIKFFTNTYYRSLVTIPDVKFEKDPHHSWIIKVWIAEELFYYAHPFLLPNFSRNNLTKDEFEVQFKVIQVFASLDLRKEFFIQEFLNNYPSKLNTRRIKNIKQYFLQYIQKLQESGFIENHYQVIINGSFIHAKQLNLINISEGFIVYEKLNI